MVLDAVAAIGLVAAIVQLADALRKTSNRIIKFTKSKRSGSLVAYLRAFEHQAELIYVAAETLKEHLDGSPQTIDRIQSFSSNLLPSTHETCQAAKAILDDYLPKDEHSLFDKFVLAFKSFEKDHRLRELMKQMKSDATSLTTMLICLGLGSPSKAMASSATWAHLQGRYIWSVPRRLVGHFVGRKATLEQLAMILETRSAAQKITVVCGMGGLGKTQLALQYCELSRAARKYSGIFWIDAMTEASTRQGFEGLADVLKTETQTFDSGEARIGFVKTMLTDWPKEWLMICDNYDNPAEFNSLADFIPNSKWGRILVTTRSHAAQRLASRSGLIDLIDMPEEEAVDLLYAASHAAREGGNDQHAKRIVHRLGCLPLAIDQAGAYLSDVGNSITLAEFLPYYEKNQLQILDTTPAVWRYFLPDTTPGQDDSTRTRAAKSVFTTWEMSLQLLLTQNNGSAKAQVLELLSYFDGTDISEEFFESYNSGVVHSEGIPSWLSIFLENGSWSQLQFGKIMGGLKVMSLIYSTSPPKENRDGFWHVSLHPLVRDWIRLRQSESQAAVTLATSSIMLAATLLKYYRTQMGTNLVWDDVHNPFWRCSWFSYTALQKLSYRPHVRAWEMIVIASDNRIPITMFDMSGTSERTASELVLLLSYHLGSARSTSSELILEKLWDRCKTDEALPMSMKCQVGTLQAQCLWDGNLGADATDLLRHLRDDWATTSKQKNKNTAYEADVEKYLNNTTYLLAEKLAFTTTTSIAEALVLAKRLARELEMCDLKDNYLAHATPLLEAAIINEAGSQVAMSVVGLRIEPLVGKGNNAWTKDDRRKHLDEVEWQRLLELHEGDGQVLAHEWMQIAEERYGKDDARTRNTVLWIAHSGTLLGDVSETISIYTDLVAKERNAYPLDRSQLSHALYRLGRLMCEHGRHELGQDNLKEAIELGGGSYKLEVLARLALSQLECGHTEESWTLWAFMHEEAAGTDFGSGIGTYMNNAWKKAQKRTRLAQERASRIYDAAIAILVVVSGREALSSGQAYPTTDILRRLAERSVNVFEDTALLWIEIGALFGYKILMARLITSANLFEFTQHVGLLDTVISAFDAKEGDPTDVMSRDFIARISALSTFIEEDRNLAERYVIWAYEAALHRYGEHDELVLDCQQTLAEVKRGDFDFTWCDSDDETEEESNVIAEVDGTPRLRTSRHR